MRQLLRRFAVTALLAPVAALGATTMITSPAEAAPAHHTPAQAGSWIPDPQKPGSRRPGSWRPGPGRWVPSWPVPARPAPAPTTPAPSKPTPAPTNPAPSTPAPTKPAPTTPAPGSSAEQSLQAEVNRLVNVQRTSNGCAALTVNDQLTAAARAHSAWMARTGTFSHTGEGGSTFATRSKAAGYARPSGENIAMGYRTAADVVTGWMNSSGHRANILNCQSKAVGVGVAYAADGSPYYTQNFGY